MREIIVVGLVGLSFLWPEISIICLPIAFILSFKYILSWIHERLFGVPRFRVKLGKVFFIRDFGKKKKVGAFILIEENPYSPFEAEDIDFWGQNKFTLEGVFTEDPDAEYCFIFVKKENDEKLLLKVSVVEDNLSEAYTRLKKILSYLRKHLGSQNIKFRFISPREAYFDFLEEHKSPKTSYTVLALAGFIAYLLFGVGILPTVISLLIVVSLVLLVLNFRKYGWGLRLKKDYVVLEINENRGLYINPHYKDILTRARMAQKSLRSPKSLVLAVKVNVGEYLPEYFEHEAERMYERGTAFDKLSQIFFATKKLAAVDRFYKKREDLYEVSIYALVDKKHLNSLKKVFNSLGFRTGICRILYPFVHKVLW